MIVVCVRTRNETRNIGRFCRQYHWADKILVADGGSEDDTVSIAKTFPNVEVREYTEKVWGNGIWRNPEGKHINFLIDWAKDEGADWIILDDCDSYPSQALRIANKTIFQMAEARGHVGIKTNHIYIYGRDRYFPEPTWAGKFCWAWKPKEVDVRADDKEEWGVILFRVPQNSLELDPPYSCIHDFCPDAETTQRKLDFYTQNGKMSPLKHPTLMWPELRETEKWMLEE